MPMYSFGGDGGNVTTTRSFLLSTKTSGHKLRGNASILASCGPHKRTSAEGTGRRIRDRSRQTGLFISGKKCSVGSDLKC